MFTGLVETTGKILEAKADGSGMHFVVGTVWESPDLKIGDSIAINGACMTVTEFSDQGNIFSFYASYKSLELTTLSWLGEGSSVNLERAMALGDRFGGHMVQGHVDGVGAILSRSQKSDGVWEFWIEVPSHLIRYFVTKGSVTVDGISLTVVDVKEDQLQLVLIPETMEKTNADHWMEKTKVNLEVDIFAKYIENYLSNRTPNH